jgi:hypothetical protein
VFVEAKIEVTAMKMNQSISSLSIDNPTCSIELYRFDGLVLKINALPIASLSAITSQFIRQDDATNYALTSATARC